MGKEHGSFREKTGHFAMWGGIIAAVIGFVTNPELVFGGGLLAAGGFALKKTGKKAA